MGLSVSKSNNEAIVEGMLERQRSSYEGMMNSSSKFLEVNFPSIDLSSTTVRYVRSLVICYSNGLMFEKMRIEISFPRFMTITIV